MASTLRTGLRAKSDTVDISSRSRNSQVNWDEFSAVAYQEHNYLKLRDDDQQIIGKVRDFFAGAGIVAPVHGLDVGAGANLYPTLAMLPFCDRIDLREFGADNLAWLRSQVPSFASTWDPFWAEFAENPVYRRVPDPRARLAEIAKVYQGSIFDLPKRTWDIGTMFFVACSISNEISEFQRAVKRFVGSLKGGAPFAAAFMIESEGYSVGNSRFPAVRIDIDLVRASLADIAYSVQIDAIETDEPLRDGYGGMCLATGWASA